MTCALIGRLISTKTLIRVAYACLSLNSIGTAIAQGVRTSTLPPAYGTTWATARAQPHGADAWNVGAESSSIGQAEASRTSQSHIRASSHRTGG